MLISTPPYYLFLVFLFFMTANGLLAQSSSKVNKVWQSKTAHPSDILDFINSTYDENGNVYLTGNHTQENGQIVLLVEKFDHDGDLSWSEEWLCNNCYAAFGVDLTLAGDHIYVAGALQPDNSIFSFDIVVQKYHISTGNMLWSQTLDNNDSANEFPVDIAVNAAGTVFVTGTTQQNGNGYDLFVASYTGSGVLNWQTTYDHANLDETAAQFQMMTNDSIRVLAASASTATDWEATLLTYTPNGSLKDSLRSAITGLDRDLPLSYFLEGDELYVGGSQLDSATNNQNAYLKKYTLNNGITEVWTKPVDINERAETLLAILKNEYGHIYATGGTADAQGDNWTWLQRFAADGSTVWQRLRAAAPAEDIISGRYFSLDSISNVVLALNHTNAAGQEVHLALYDSSGYRRWEVPLVTSEEKAIASNLLVPNNKHIYVVGVFKETDGTQFYHVNKLEKYEKENTIVTDSLGNPRYIAEDLLIRFAPCVLDTPFVDNHDLYFGKVDEVVNDAALILQMDSLLGAGGTLGDWRLFKVFDTFDTHVTTIRGRQGVDINAPPLWATFVLEIGEGAQIKEPPAVRDTLAMIGVDKIRFTHPNYLGKLPTAKPSVATSPPPPIDPLYVEQFSLFDPLAGVNMQPAWDIMDAVGENNWVPDPNIFEDDVLNIALMDSGVRFQHEDLRCPTCPGILPLDGGNRSIVVEALDFGTTSTITDLSTQIADEQDTGSLTNDPLFMYGHGTRTAGILSAIRNTNGIAGITSDPSHAVQLHSYRTAESDDFASVEGFLNGLGFVLNYCQDTGGYICPEDPPTLDLLCLEIAYDPSEDSTSDDPQERIESMRELIGLAYDAQYIQTTARGNEGDTRNMYPATYEDRWLVSVGASGSDGQRVRNGINTSIVLPESDFDEDGYSSNYGLEMDLTAPGIHQLVRTTSNVENSHYHYFSGTSAALPHVTGTTAQLMLHHPTALAQEDVEHLLEYTATDVSTLSYDEENGWGRLNAGKALEFIDPGHDNYRVVQVEINGDIPFDDDPFGCGDDCYFSVAYPINSLTTEYSYVGTIRKYTYEFAIDVSVYGSVPTPFSDPNKKLVWTRSSATNLWFTPEFIQPGGLADNYLFLPDNHLFFDGSQEPFFDGNTLRGLISGYTFIIKESELDNTVQLICSDGKQTANSNNPIDFHECHYGSPRLTFSFLVEDPISNGNVIITNTKAPNDLTEDIMSVYPNPTTNQCRVQIVSAVSGEAILALYNLEGQRLQQHTLRIFGKSNTETHLDLSGYPSGMYLLRLQTDFGILTQKIIKQ